jgi:hypothetical protein
LVVAGELSVAAGCEAAGAEVVALAAEEEPVELLLPAAGAVAEPPAVVVAAGEPLLLLFPLHAETDRAAVSASTAPVEIFRFIWAPFPRTSWPLGHRRKQATSL